MLSCIIQESEWVMGLREETFVDELRKNASSAFSDN